MFTRDKLFNEVKAGLKKINNKGGEYSKFAEMVSAEVSKLKKWSKKSKDKDTVVNFRLGMNKLLKEESNNLTKDHEVQYILYKALVTAAVVQPINDTDIVTMENIEDIPSDKIIALSDGYVFDLEQLAQWIKNRGKMENSVTNVPFTERDQLEIKKAAMNLKPPVNLNELDHTKYKVEEPPAMLIGAISIAQASDRAPHQGFSMFNPNTSFIRDVSDATGIAADELVRYQAAHPYRFEKLVIASPYIKNGLLTPDEAKNLSEAQATALNLAIGEAKGTPEELQERVAVMRSLPGRGQRNR
jgi:hypothetical protein